MHLRVQRRSGGRCSARGLLGAVAVLPMLRVLWSAHEVLRGAQVLRVMVRHVHGLGEHEAVVAWQMGGVVGIGGAGHAVAIVRRQQPVLLQATVAVR